MAKTLRVGASATKDKGDRLLDAAAVALVDGGGAFEVQDVAKRAGVSVGLAYHRFGSKAGLVAAVVDRLYDELLQAIDLPDWPLDDWGGRERERTRRFIDFAYDTPLAAVVFSKLAADPEVSVVAAQRWNGVVEEGARNLAQGQRGGVVPTKTDPQVLSALINGAVRHAVAQALANELRPTRERLTDDVWSFVAAGLGIRPSTTS
jgi:AcrR family transcriptional regulator